MVNIWGIIALDTLRRSLSGRPARGGEEPMEPRVRGGYGPSREARRRG